MVTAPHQIEVLGLAQPLIGEIAVRFEEAVAGRVGARPFCDHH